MRKQFMPRGDGDGSILSSENILLVFFFLRLGNSTVNISQMKWAQVLAAEVWHIWTGNTAGSVNVNVDCMQSE